MKKILSIAAGLLISASVFAETGLEIMKRADAVPTPKNSTSKATLNIHSKKGGDRVREVIIKNKDYGEVSKEVIIFTTPKDVAGVGYLMFEYEEKSDGSKKDSDNWLYMPAMNKTRRIAASGSEAEGSFMGTDFTYDDMGERALSKDDFTLLGEEDVNGVTCYKIEAVSKTGTEKDPKRVVYIGKEDLIVRKAEYYNLHGGLHRILTADNVTTVNGYTSAKFMKMENVQTGSWSTIEIKDTQNDLTELDDSIFTVAAMEKGRIR